MSRILVNNMNYQSAPVRFRGLRRCPLFTYSRMMYWMFFFSSWAGRAGGSLSQMHPHFCSCLGSFAWLGSSCGFWLLEERRMCFSNRVSGLLSPREEIPSSLPGDWWRMRPIEWAFRSCAIRSVEKLSDSLGMETCLLRLCCCDCGGLGGVGTGGLDCSAAWTFAVRASSSLNAGEIFGSRYLHSSMRERWCCRLRRMVWNFPSSASSPTQNFMMRRCSTEIRSSTSESQDCYCCRVANPEQIDILFIFIITAEYAYSLLLPSKTCLDSIGAYLHLLYMLSPEYIPEVYWR